MHIIVPVIYMWNEHSTQGFYYFPVVQNCELLKFKLRIRLESEDIQHQNVYFFFSGFCHPWYFIYRFVLFIHQYDKFSFFMNNTKMLRQSNKSMSPIPHILKSTAWAKMTCLEYSSHNMIKEKHTAKTQLSIGWPANGPQNLLWITIPNNEKHVTKYNTNRSGKLLKHSYFLLVVYSLENETVKSRSQ